MNRRQLISTSAATGAGVLTGSALVGGRADAAAPSSPAGSHARPDGDRLFGPLASQPGDLLALPEGFSYSVVARSGETDLVDADGKTIGKTPERPDGTLVVAHGLRLPAGPEPRGAARAAARRSRSSRAPSTTRGALGGGCTVIDAQPPGRAPLRVGRPLRHDQQLRRRPDPVGHLADLRGDRGQGRHRHPAEGPRLRVRGLRRPARPSRSPQPIEASAGSPHEAVVIEPSRDARLPHRGRQQAHRAVLPLDRARRLPAEAPQGIARHARQDDAGTLEALAVLDRRRQRAARPGLRHRGARSAARSRPAG